jgi:hypothetical protein
MAGTVDFIVAYRLGADRGAAESILPLDPSSGDDRRGSPHGDRIERPALAVTKTARTSAALAKV